jgi:hypothetical protein
MRQDVLLMLIFQTVRLENKRGNVTHGTESWPLTTKHENIIIATEMKFLRRIMGKTRRDKWRNNRI